MWLVINMSDHHCSLVVNVHMVMENLQASFIGQDSIGHLENMFKLKIKMLADGLDMTSFDARNVPQYFLHASVHKVVKHNTSYFETTMPHISKPLEAMTNGICLSQVSILI
jgi:hypothetical protein